MDTYCYWALPWRTRTLDFILLLDFVRSQNLLLRCHNLSVAYISYLLGLEKLWMLLSYYPCDFKVQTRNMLHIFNHKNLILFFVVILVLDMNHHVGFNINYAKNCYCLGSWMAFSFKFQRYPPFIFQCSKFSHYFLKFYFSNLRESKSITILGQNSLSLSI